MPTKKKINLLKNIHWKEKTLENENIDIMQLLLTSLKTLKIYYWKE